MYTPTTQTIWSIAVPSFTNIIKVFYRLPSYKFIAILQQFAPQNNTTPTKRQVIMYIPSSIFTLKDVPSYNNELFCLAINPHMYCGSNHNEPTNNCARQNGGTIDVWDCNSVEETYNDNIPQRDLIASWHIDESGVLVSELSGMCLTWVENNNHRIYQSDCDEKYAVIYDNGLMKVQYNTDLCIVPNLDDDNYAGSSGLGLKVDDCNNMQGYWGYDENPVVVYPTPTEEGWNDPDYWADEKSVWYQTFITINEGDFTGKKLESAMYKSEVTYHKEVEGDKGAYDDMMSYYNEWQNHSNSFTTFSYDYQTDITITVKKLQGAIPYNNVVIRPSRIASITNQDSDSVSFTLNPDWGGVKKLSVEFDDEYKYNSCLLFVDGLEDENYDFHPSMFAPNVHYYGVGYHTVNQELKEGDQVYVAGGAFLLNDPGSNKPIFYTKDDGEYVNDIHIGGRGIVSGKKSDYNSWLVQLCGLNVYVTGITLANSFIQSNLGVNEPWYCKEGWNPTSLTDDNGAQIYNVKLMGWYASDGINAGQYGKVSFSFVKVNDDGIKPFYTGSEFKDLVIWQMHNGWAIMLAWLSDEDQHDIYVHDITIIHDDHSDCQSMLGWNCDFAVTDPDGNTGSINSQATIGADQGGSGKISNVHVKDITIETRVLRPFFLGVQKNFWGKTGAGVLDTWTFENISFWELGQETETSKILGGPLGGYQVNNIKFINLQYEDHGPLTSWDPTYFEYTQDFGRDVGAIYFCANDPCPSSIDSWYLRSN